MLLMEPKASQSLPALQAPVSNRNSRSLQGGGPEVFFVVHVPVALLAFIAGRSRNAPPPSITRPAPDAAPLFPPSPEHAFHAARGCVCPDGLPVRTRSQTRHCPGLSVRGGPMRVDGATNSELIHQWRARPDLAADADRQPQRPAGVINPAVAEMHARDGSPICIFKTDRAGSRAGAGPRTLWVGAAARWSRAAPNHLTTDRPGDGIRPAHGC